MSPLASEPAIQDAMADKITEQVFTYIDVEGITRQALEALKPGLARSCRPSCKRSAFRSPMASRASRAARWIELRKAMPSLTPG